MRRYLIEVVAIFVIGLVASGFSVWQSGSSMDLRNVALALLFWIIASFLIPARSAILRVRRERALDKRTIERTFE